jgi:hypothetical protein
LEKGGVIVISAKKPHSLKSGEEIQDVSGYDKLLEYVEVCLSVNVNYIRYAERYNIYARG